MTKILVFSGRKQSGKNTSGNFLLSVAMAELGVFPEGSKYWIGDDGLIRTTNILGNAATMDDPWVFDPAADKSEMDKLINEHMTFYPEDSDPFPYIKLYSFADPLKEDVCMNILGLTWEHCYGNDKQKDSMTHLEWKNWNVNSKNPTRTHRTGFMTGRDVMQHVGTEFFRNIYNDCWVNATINRIKKDNPELAIITDCRFPNEVLGTQKAGAKVIRLTRGNLEDKHESETALDKDKFDWNKFDAIIDNVNMTIGEQNKKLSQILQQWGWMK